MTNKKKAKKKPVKRKVVRRKRKAKVEAKSGYALTAVDNCLDGILQKPFSEMAKEPLSFGRKEKWTMKDKIRLRLHDAVYTTGQRLIDFAYRYL